jgi:hypothetical protein
LPGSKRYPDNVDEYQEILRRHNTLCSDLFSKSEAIYLLLTQGSDTKKVISPKYIEHKISSISYLTSVIIKDKEADDNTQYFYHIWSCKLHWEFGILDELLKKVADWEIVNLILVDSHSNYLYYPYDGGADIIVTSSAERDSYKKSTKPGYLTAKMDFDSLKLSGDVEAGSYFSVTVNIDE